jgi:hypothetical protein
LTKTKGISTKRKEANQGMASAVRFGRQKTQDFALKRQSYDDQRTKSKNHRQRYRKLHRVLGRIHVAGVFVAAPLGVYIQYF